MKLIVAGSRSIHLGLEGIKRVFDLSYEFYRDLREAVDTAEEYDELEIVSGGCTSGPDAGAKLWCASEEVSYKEFSADWDQYGKAAGPIRNKEMAEYGDALLLVWDGDSKGSANMKAEMEKLKKPVYEIILKAR